MLLLIPSCHHSITYSYSRSQLIISLSYLEVSTIHSQPSSSYIHTHMYTYTHTHTHTHTYIHTYIHTYTHTHTFFQLYSLSDSHPLRPSIPNTHLLSMFPLQLPCFSFFPFLLPIVSRVVADATVNYLPNWGVLASCVSSHSNACNLNHLTLATQPFIIESSIDPIDPIDLSHILLLSSFRIQLNSWANLSIQQSTMATESAENGPASNPAEFTWL